MKVAVVGANRGIGLAIVKQLHAEGMEIDAFCRQQSNELSSLKGVRVCEGFDVTQPDKVEQLLAEKYAKKSWDWLIYVSGILRSDNLKSLNGEDLREQFEVNTLSPLLVTRAFLPHLAKGSKIGLLSSRMGSVADNTSGGMYGYRISKSGLNMAGKGLAEDLKGQGIVVLLLHPGYVQTDMTGHMGDITPEQSASGLIRILKEKTMEQTGQFWHTNGEELPW